MNSNHQLHHLVTSITFSIPVRRGQKLDSRVVFLHWVLTCSLDGLSDKKMESGYVLTFTLDRLSVGKIELGYLIRSIALY